MFEVTVIVPVRDNDGKALTGERHKIEGELLTLAGGFSRDKIVGQWRGDDGRVYRDESYRYTVACTGEVVRQLTDRASEWCSVLRQEALFVSARAVQVEFVQPVKAVA